MTISDAIHDHMMNLLDEVVEWHADRLESPRYRDTFLRVLATMHNAVIKLDGYDDIVNDFTLEDSFEKMKQMLHNLLCERIS
jgi:hypothetical protein